MKATHQIPKAFRELYEAKARYFVYYGGRGGAKSWAVAQYLLFTGFNKKIRVLCTRELQGSIKESVHKLLSDQISQMGLDDFYTITQDSIKGRNGTEFMFLGIKHDPLKIKSTEGVDICWVEEAEKVSAQSWRILIPTIRKDDSFFIVTFNPSLKTDATYIRFILNPPEGAIVRKVSWRDNPWFPDVLKNEMEHDKSMDYDDYLHVWEGELKQFADGAIYQQQLRKLREDGRITDVPIENVESFSFWDLGRNDHTAIWVMQRVGLQNRFIHYYENRLVDMEHYVKWIKDLGLTWGGHYMPHDAEVQVIGMARNRRQMFEDLGLKPIIVVPRISDINTGIDMTKKFFASCWFDKTRCDRGIETLANYQYVYDEKFDTHRKTPLHNWASNGADAFRQAAQGFDHEMDDWSGQIDYPDLGII